MIFRLVAKMTLDELNEHYDDILELRKAEALLESLRMAAYPQYGLTGMPGTNAVKDKVGDLAIEIAETSDCIMHIKQKVMADEQKIVDFLDTVDDLVVRTILRLRFIRGLLWTEVAEVSGSGDEDSVKKASYRYMRNLSRDVL